MTVLYWLEGLRNPVLDALFSLITRLGEETVFLLLAVTIFWCVDKRRGYYLLFVGFFGTVVSQTLKLAFRIPRPWVRDPAFTIVESARAQATGYSFPSGHTQVAVGTFGSLAYATRRRSVRILSIVAAVAVPISRLYLGVHTPLDVAVSAAVALALVLLLGRLLNGEEAATKRIPALLGAGVLLTAAALLWALFHRFPTETDPVQLAHGQEQLAKLAGAAAGMLIAYPLDRRFLRFETAGAWYVQVVKLLLGAAAVIGVKAGLKYPLQALLGPTIGGGVRYCIVLLVAAVVVPATFAPLSRLLTRGRGDRQADRDD